MIIGFDRKRHFPDYRIYFGFFFLLRTFLQKVFTVIERRRYSMIEFVLSICNDAQITGGLWFRQKATASGQEDMDVLRHARVRGPRSDSEQGPRPGRGLLGAGNTRVRAAGRNVSCAAVILVLHTTAKTYSI